MRDISIRELTYRMFPLLRDRLQLNGDQMTRVLKATMYQLVDERILLLEALQSEEGMKKPTAKKRRPSRAN